MFFDETAVLRSSMPLLYTDILTTEDYNRMLSLIISFIIALGISGACMASEIKSGVVAYGILGFIASQILITLIVRKKSKVINTELQEMMTVGQKQINHKVTQFQSKPGGNISFIQRQIEQDQQKLFRTALELTQKLEVFKPWNMLMNKQLSTMRLQFLYQLKEFDQVDEILAKGWLASPFLSDPMLVAMKMARQFKCNDISAVEKTFKRHILWFRNDNGALLYGVMSWIYVKENKLDEALELLTKAKDKMFHEAINRNWEMLSNDRIKNFSNVAFGDAWYSLFLEKPPAVKQKRMRSNAKSHRPF